MACYCPYICCYDCDNYRHVAMDCPDKILPSGTPSHHRTTTGTGIGDPPLGDPVTPDVCATTTRTGSRFSCSRSCPHNHSYQSSSQHEHHRNCSRSSLDIPAVAPSALEAPAHTTIVETLPTPDLLATTPPGVTADPGITPNTATTTQPEDHHQQHRHHPENMRQETDT